MKSAKTVMGFVLFAVLALPALASADSYYTYPYSSYQYPANYYGGGYYYNFDTAWYDDDHDRYDRYDNYYYDHDYYRYDNYSYQNYYPYYYGGKGSDVALTASYVPYLPNTGFEPKDSIALAFAVVSLIAVALVVYPYARKAFADIRS